MKNKFWLVYTVFLASSLVAINLVCASEEGSSGRGGGDPTIMRALLIREFIEGDLKTEVSSAWKKLRFRSIPDPKIANAIEDMDTSGFLDDLNSPYIVANECYAMDEQGAKVKKPASAEMNKRNGPICFDVTSLALQNVSKKELIAIAIHEHSHHFGYIDSDHAIAREVMTPDYKENESGAVGYSDFLGHYKFKASDPSMPPTWSCAPSIDISSWKNAKLFIVFDRSSTESTRIQPDYWLAGGFDQYTLPDEPDLEANAPFVWTPDGKSHVFSNDPAQSQQWGPYTEGRVLSTLEGRVLSRVIEWRKCHSGYVWDNCSSYAFPAHQEIRLEQNGDITVTNEMYRLGEKINFRTSCKYKRVNDKAIRFSASSSNPRSPVLIQACNDESVNLRSAPVGHKCYTSQGTIFERVAKKGFGEAWKGPDGLIWSIPIGSFWLDGVVKEGLFVDSAAGRRCAQLGGRLPSRSDFEGGEENGFREVLPNIKDQWTWTSSSTSFDRFDDAYAFVGYDGSFEKQHHSASFSVRCVSP